MLVSNVYAGLTKPCEFSLLLTIVNFNNRIIILYEIAFYLAANVSVNKTNTFCLFCN